MKSCEYCQCLFLQNVWEFMNLWCYADCLHGACSIKLFTAVNNDIFMPVEQVKKQA